MSDGPVRTWWLRFGTGAKWHAWRRKEPMTVRGLCGANLKIFTAQNARRPKVDVCRRCERLT